MTVLLNASLALTNKEPGFVSRLDTKLDEASWYQYGWGSFLRAWVACMVVTAAAGFVVSLIMIGAYELVLS